MEIRARIICVLRPKFFYMVMQEALFEIVNSWTQQTFMGANLVPSRVPEVGANWADTAPYPPGAQGRSHMTYLR